MVYSGQIVLRWERNRDAMSESTIIFSQGHTKFLIPKNTTRQQGSWHEASKIYTTNATLT